MKKLILLSLLLVVLSGCGRQDKLRNQARAICIDRGYDGVYFEQDIECIDWVYGPMTGRGGIKSCKSYNQVSYCYEITERLNVSDNMLYQ